MEHLWNYINVLRLIFVETKQSLHVPFSIIFATDLFATMTFT